MRKLVVGQDVGQVVVGYQVGYVVVVVQHIGQQQTSVGQVRSSMLGYSVVVGCVGQVGSSMLGGYSVVGYQYVVGLVRQDISRLLCIVGTQQYARIQCSSRLLGMVGTRQQARIQEDFGVEGKNQHFDTLTKYEVENDKV